MREKIGRMSKVLTVVGLVGILVTLTAGIALALERVTVQGNRFVRKHEYINRGERVRWVNNTNRFHNIKSTNIAKNWNYFRRLPGNSVRSRVFNQRGTYIYRCTIHSQIVNGACDGMCGFIHVGQG